jgi:hypothetical protein
MSLDQEFSAQEREIKDPQKARPINTFACGKHESVALLEKDVLYIN